MPASSKPAEDDGRRCHACKGPHRPLVKYAVALRRDAELRAILGIPSHGAVVDMHPTCVGSWLMGNEGQQHALAFAPGELGKNGQHYLHPPVGSAAAFLCPMTHCGTPTTPHEPSHACDRRKPELCGGDCVLPAGHAGGCSMEPQADMFTTGGK